MSQSYRISFTPKEVEEGIEFLQSHASNPFARKLLFKFQLFQKKIEVGIIRPHHELKPKVSLLDQISGVEVPPTLTLQEKKERVFAEWKANPNARVWTENELDWIEQIKDPIGYAEREEAKALKELGF